MHGIRTHRQSTYTLRLVLRDPSLEFMSKDVLYLNFGPVEWNRNMTPEREIKSNNRPPICRNAGQRRRLPLTIRRLYTA